MVNELQEPPFAEIHANTREVLSQPKIFLSNFLWCAVGGVLINLGNMAPVRRQSHVLLIHDAKVFATPGGNYWKYPLWYKFAHRRFLKGGACVATVSGFARSALQRCLWTKPGGISVISEGADHIDKSLTQNVVGMVTWRLFMSIMRERATHDGAEPPLMAVSTEAQQARAIWPFRARSGSGSKVAAEYGVLSRVPPSLFPQCFGWACFRWAVIC